jgi:uncharacterized protein YjdB
MKVRTSVLRGFALLALSSLTFAACDESTTPPAPPAPTVTVAPSNVSLQVGQTATLSAVVSGAANQNITWRSGNPAVATVSAAGVVTAVTPGTTGIIAISQADTTSRAAASVTVTAAPVAPVVPVTLTLVPSEAQVQVDNTVQLVGIVGGPANVSQVVNYTSSVPAVATVTATGGLVRGVTPGTAVITARAGANASVVQTSTITVTAGPPATPVTVSITPTTATTGVGDSVRFVANVHGSTNTGVTWTSTNTAVVRVNAQGYAVGVAAGTAVITAASAANPAATVNATVIVTAAPPPTPSASISIASVTTAGGTTINPAAVAGQINATVNVSAVPANDLRAVVLSVDGVQVCRQNYTQPLGTTQGVATINCPINTAATDTAGAPVFLNGPRIIRAFALNGAGQEITSAEFCPLGQTTNCAVTFANTNNFAISWAVNPVTSSGPVLDANNVAWNEGGITVTVRPALYAPVAIDSFQVTVGGVTRWAKSPTGNAYTVVFPKTGTNSLAAIESAAVGVTIGTVRVTGGGTQTAAFTAPATIALDNVGPTVPAAPVIPASGWIGSNQAWTIAGFSVPAPTDAGVGLPTPAATAPYTLQTSPSTGTLTWTTRTSVTELAETITNTGYRLRVVACDRLGNCNNGTASAVGGFGVDLTAPSFTIASGPADNATNNLTPHVFSITDVNSGFGASPVEVRVQRYRGQAAAATCVNPNTGAALTNCADSLAYVALTNPAATTLSPAAYAFDNLAPGLDDDGYYVITVRVRDQAGNLSTTATQTQLFDNNSPTVTSPVITLYDFTSGAMQFTANAADSSSLHGYQQHVQYANGVILPSALNVLSTYNPTTRVPTTSVSFSATMSALQLTDATTGAVAGAAAPAAPAAGRVQFWDIAGNNSVSGWFFPLNPNFPATGYTRVRFDTLAVAVRPDSFAVTLSGATICNGGTGCGTVPTTRTLTARVAGPSSTFVTPFTSVSFYVTSSTGITYLVATVTANTLQELDAPSRRTFTYSATLDASAFPLAAGAGQVFAVGHTANNSGLRSSTPAITVSGTRTNLYPGF